ncbi:MAG: MerR family transcriptional regulator, light-induced transcriptional regulator [Solirubrobacteraceae bacterium]|nr:MerR family transcriptional regulator, light-induced transcriptional regulator [Solirubrobacteraceae bacterium]
MRTLRTSEAATLLSVSPTTLRTWERRFGYPRPRRSDGRHRLYTHGEIAALGNALRDGLSIQSAISRVRESLGGDTDTLIDALIALDGTGADLAMESALALRTFDRCVEDVLLRGLDELAGQTGEASATWALAARWADGWLRRAQRLAPPPHGRLTVMLGDAGCGDIDGDLLALRALQLFCDRGGMRVVALPVGCVAGLRSVSETLAPDAIVIAGSGPTHERAPAWAHHIEAQVGSLPLALFRCPELVADPRAADAWVLPNAPHEAHRDLLARIELLAAPPAVDGARDAAPARPPRESKPELARR